MDLGILGPLQAWEDGEPLPLGGGKQRALLADLILHRGEVVSTDCLIEDLWGSHPPPSAHKSVQVYVSHLRKALSNTPITTHGHGYRLDLEPGQLDLDRFAELAADGRRLLDRGDTRGAADRLRAALSLWRGPPLADVAYEPFAQSEIVRLDEARLAAIEDRIDADLERGGQAALVPELEALIREHPLSERLHAQLMLALYRTGRQAEALEVCRDLRRRLDDDLGLEPARELRELEQSVLAQDRALDAPARPWLGPRSAQGRARTGRLLLLAGLTVLAIAVALAASEMTRETATTTVLPPGSIGRVDPETGRVRSSTPIPGRPGRLAATDAIVWVGLDQSDALVGVARGLRITRVGAAGGSPTDLAAGEGGLWILDGMAGVVTQVRPDSGTIIRRVRLLRARAGTVRAARSAARRPWAIAVGERRVWVTDGSTRLRVIGARSGRIAAALELHVPLTGVAVGAGAVWAISGPRATLLRIDPRTRSVTDRIRIARRDGPEAAYPVAVETGAGSVWVLNAHTRTLTRIDARQRAIAATAMLGERHGPARLAAGDAAAWVASRDGTLSRIDARTNAVRSFSVGNGLRDVAVTRDGVWVTAGARANPVPRTAERRR